MTWTAIWDRSGAHHAPHSPLPQQGRSTFVFEGRLAQGGHDQDLWTGSDIANDPFSISQDSHGQLLVRQGSQSKRIDSRRVGPGDPFHLTVSAAPDRRFALLHLKNLANGQSFAVSLDGVAPLQLEDVAPPTTRLAEGAEFAAFANQDAPIGEFAGFETGTLIDTPFGPRPIESLAIGDIVVTAQGAPARLINTDRREALSMGAMAVIRMRAPYFGLKHDVLLSPYHHVALSGPEVEYMFGCPTVHAMACDLVDHVSVQQDFTKQTRILHRLHLDRSGYLGLGRTQVEAGSSDMGDCPRIDRINAHALRAMQDSGRDLLG